MNTPTTDQKWANITDNIEGFTVALRMRQLCQQLETQRNELLEALEKLLERSYQFTDEGPLLEGWKSDEFESEIKAAESAIAKAKGETP